MQVFALQILTISLSIAAVVGIHCYDCNSKFDLQCDDPFKDYPLGKVDCDELKNSTVPADVKATFCRKIIQKVNDEKRVIRSCGFYSEPDNGKKCRKSTPSKGVEIFSCECRGEMCNESQHIRASIYSIIITSLSYFVSKIFLVSS